MKKSKIIRWISVWVICVSMFSEAARKDEVTLVMVPREEATIRVGMDLSQRYPTLLLSYTLGANNAISLHGWTGTQWVNVSVEDFVSGQFFKNGPDSALLVEQAGRPVPKSLIPPLDWCANVAKITTTEVRPLLHLTGQYFDFSYKDWGWFARRYGMKSEAINPEGLNTAWYQKRMVDHMKTRDVLAGSDLQYWVSVRQAVEVEPANPVAEAAAEADEAAARANEPVGNPFTNDAPVAVVLGAADASEEPSEAM